MFALKNADAKMEPFLKCFQIINLLLAREDVLTEEPLAGVSQGHNQWSKGICKATSDGWAPRSEGNFLSSEPIPM